MNLNNSACEFVAKLLKYSFRAFLHFQDLIIEIIKITVKMYMFPHSYTDLQTSYDIMISRDHFRSNLIDRL